MSGKAWWLPEFAALYENLDYCDSLSRSHLATRHEDARKTLFLVFVFLLDAQNAVLMSSSWMGIFSLLIQPDQFRECLLFSTAHE